MGSIPTLGRRFLCPYVAMTFVTRFIAYMNYMGEKVALKTTF